MKDFSEKDMYPNVHEILKRRHNGSRDEVVAQCCIGRDPALKFCRYIADFVVFHGGKRISVYEVKKMFRPSDICQLTCYVQGLKENGYKVMISAFVVPGGRKYPFLEEFPDMNIIYLRKFKV